jgi:hypothetical protein
LVKDKREFVQAIDALVATGVSCHQAHSQVAGLSHYYNYALFKKVIEKVHALEKGDAFVSHKINGTPRAFQLKLQGMP